MPSDRKMRRGVTLAAMAALAFGGTTPLVAWARAGSGPFAAAGLLYAGSALAALVLGGRPSTLGGARMRYVVPMVAFGAVLAPAAYMAGFARAGATATSLVTNAEAPATVLLAALFLGERFGARVGLALVLMVGAGTLLVLDRGDDAAFDGVGIALASLAPLGWAADNVLARKLGNVPAFDIVLVKGALGAGASLAIAFALGETWPGSVWRALALLGLGAVGYGLSLRAFLAAQAEIGAGRTSSVFAMAPFVGALLAAPWDDRAPGWLTAVAAAVFAIAVALHATERPNASPEAARG